MKKNYILKVFVAVLPFFYVSIAMAQENIKVYSDSVAVKYFNGGMMDEGKLHIVSKEEYKDLDMSQKAKLLEPFANDFKTDGIVVHTGNTCSEIWLRKSDGRMAIVDRWNMNNPQISDFMPIDLEKGGANRLFWYAGGSLNATKGAFSATINARAGTFLYKDIIDCSVLTDLGVSSGSGATSFNGDIGLMGRAYIPIRKSKKVPFAPYGGLGVNFNFAPTVYFELVLYTGISLYVGPGSIDVGVQYGLKSKFAATFGYTFRPVLKKALKKQN